MGGVCPRMARKGGVHPQHGGGAPPEWGGYTPNMGGVRTPLMRARNGQECHYSQESGIIGHYGQIPLKVPIMADFLEILKIREMRGGDQ